MNRQIIQGGMGVYVSTPYLAKSCSMHDNVLGTVSCVAAGPILVRILQSGDSGGHFRRALAHFPFAEVASSVVRKYFVDGGIPAEQKFKPVPICSLKPHREIVELSIVASFSLVWLAKEGHTGPVSMNLLEKMQRTLLYEIFGAMLAGVDYVTMGAGITLQIPAVLDALSMGEPASYRVAVLESKEGTQTISFDPACFFNALLPELKRPDFLPIVSTDVLASLMAKRLPANSIQGFVVEKPIAAGHNAPPRGTLVVDEKGQPVYGPRDAVAFEKLVALGIPFWIGGGFASPEGLARAQALGAVGIQAGSIFALCEDSGMPPTFRREIRRLGRRGELVVRTDPTASPTGFPFKVVQLQGTQSDPTVYTARERVCDLCALAVPSERCDSTVGFRCPGEPEVDYARKGGKSEDTPGVRCLCNGLLSAAGLGNPGESPIFTLGDDVGFLRHLMEDESSSYTARDAVAYLLRGTA